MCRRAPSKHAGRDRAVSRPLVSVICSLRIQRELNPASTICQDTQYIMHLSSVHMWCPVFIRFVRAFPPFDAPVYIFPASIQSIHVFLAFVFSRAVSGVPSAGVVCPPPSVLVICYSVVLSVQTTCPRVSPWCAICFCFVPDLLTRCARHPPDLFTFFCPMCDPPRHTRDRLPVHISAPMHTAQHD